MEKLPENWESLSHHEKHLFFARNYMKYIRDGETDGLYDWTPQEIRDAYMKYKQEEDR